MKRFRILRILSVALTLALLVATVPVTPALAAEYVRLSPDEGEIGDSIEAWGSGYEVAIIKLYFTDEVASPGDEIDTDVENYEYLGQETVDGSGSFEGFYFDVPSRLRDGDTAVRENVRGGTYYVYVTDYYGEILAEAEFTVETTAEITLDPDEGLVGTTVEITGIGFGDREDITIEYANKDVDIESGDTRTDSDGEFECTIIIPESTAGDHEITVTGDDSDITAAADFTVEPSITVSPESGVAGSSVTVGGTGFGDEVDVEVSFDGDKVADDDTDDDGSFEVTFIVPSLGAGSYDINVEDDDGNDADAEFTIGAAAISISPTSGHVGTEVTVHGTGFQASKPVTITFNNDIVKTTSSDAYGGVSIKFNIPVVGAGTYTVKVTDGTNTAQSNFSISTSASISPETSAASPGHVGTELTLSGVGFIAGETVTITYDGTEVTTATVDPTGGFNTSFNAPESSSGQHTIIASDGTNTTQFTFVMESTPPSTIYPQLPLMNTKLEDWRFDWCGDATDLSKEVTDDSQPVTYTLQIATTEAFSSASIVLEEPGLTESEYTIPKENRLDPTSEENPYYWRVKAIDSASNEGAWSGVGVFYVGGLSWSLPTPAIIALIVVGVLVLGVLAFWFGRKTAYY